VRKVASILGLLATALCAAGFLGWLYWPTVITPPPQRILGEAAAPKEKPLVRLPANDEEYRIYSATIEYLFQRGLNWNGKKSAEKVSSLVVLGFTKTRLSPPGDDERSRLLAALHKVEVQPSIAEDFLTRNESSVLLLEPLVLSKKCHYISRKEYEYIFDHGGAWSVFNQRYPNTLGVMAVSRPGIQQGVALVYGEFGRDYSGFGVYLILRQDAGGWRVTGEIPLWVS